MDNQSAQTWCVDPEDSLEEHFGSSYDTNLDLTPSTAREIVLLAELVGWTALVPVLLDIANRPNRCVLGI